MAHDKDDEKELVDDGLPDDCEWCGLPLEDCACDEIEEREEMME